MAQRRSGAAATPEADPTLKVMRSQLDREIEERLEGGQQLLDRQVQNIDGIDELRRDFYTWNDYNEELLARRFTSREIANEYRMVAISFGGRGTPQQELKWVRHDIAGQRRKLESVRQRLDLIDEPPLSKIEQGPGSVIKSQQVFVVHGHNNATKLEVVDFIERITGKRPTILHEPASRGRTIIEKLEDHGGDAGFAVVLLTGDDYGSVKGSKVTQPRARQNVVFEFGYFIGKLGRGNVVAIFENGVEPPSDLEGVIYLPLSNWQLDLAKEMKAAKIEIDMNKAT